MTRRSLMGTFAPWLLMAQSDKFPSRRFKYGEELKGKGYTVTLQEFGFQVHSTNPEVDHVEIVVGREWSSPDMPWTRLLRFETFTGVCPVSRESARFSAVDVALGNLANIETVRTIQVTMLKVKSQEMFR